MKNKSARNSQLIQIIVISLALHITEADDDKSRHPYSYKYTVVDEDTNNNYQVSCHAKTIPPLQYHSSYSRLRSLAILR